MDMTQSRNGKKASMARAQSPGNWYDLRRGWKGEAGPDHAGSGGQSRTVVFI